MTDQNALAIFEKTSPEDLAKLPTEISGESVLNNPQAMAHLGNLSRAFSYSKLVPDHYQGKPHEIFIALESARNLGVDPMVFLQGTTVIHGRQGMNAALMNSLLKRSKKVKGAVRYEEQESEEIAFGKVKNLRVRAWGIEAETGEPLHGPWVDLKMAAAEGWTRNSKYTSMPGIMLEKRALTFFVRRFFPEVLNGMDEETELQDQAFADGHEAPQMINPELESSFEIELGSKESPKSGGTKGAKQESERKNETQVEEKPAVETQKESTQKSFKPGTKDWYKQELDKMGKKYASSASLPDLKKLFAEETKRRKEAAEAQEAELQEGPEVIPPADIPEAEEAQEQNEENLKFDPLAEQNTSEESKFNGEELDEGFEADPLFGEEEEEDEELDDEFGGLFPE